MWLRAVAVVVSLLVLAAPASALDVERLSRVLTRQMRMAGPTSGVYVADAASGAPVYGLRDGVPRTPASVEKLWTTAAVLTRFGDRHRFTTAVLKDQRIELDGSVRGSLYLRGAGDPTLTTRDLRTLAREVKRAGILTVDGGVVGDATAFDAHRGLAAAGFAATPDVPPLSALMIDRGQIRKGLIAYQSHPALFAAATLTRLLRDRGVRVLRRPAAGRTPLLGWAVAAVRSPTVRTLLRHQNVASDNYIAEMLARSLVGRRRASTEAGAAIVRRIARRRFGAAPTVADGSGISPGDASTPRDIVSLLVREVRDRAFVRSLAIAGRSGTVALRLRGPLTYNRCRLKTGTLTGVSALAGYCSTLGGQTLALAILMNGVDTYAAHTLQDRMVTALAAYDP